MDKKQKHDYTNHIEDFLETNQVYELFEDLLLRDLVVSKPDNPLDFITQTLSNPKTRRIFMTGAPGCCKGEMGMRIADNFQWRYISVTEALTREEARKTDDGKRITDCQTANKLVDDDIVIKLVKQEIDRAEEAH